MATATVQFELNASTDTEAATPRPLAAYFCQAQPVSREDAEALLATFPKGYRGKIGQRANGFVVQFRVNLWSTPSNSRNEAGIKRCASIMARCDVVYVAKFANSPATLGEFLALLGN